MAFIYNLFVTLLIFGMKVFHYLMIKLKKELKEKTVFRRLKLYYSKRQVIWMHAASLGEYEQGLPVLEG
jgi:3-deoxy-D-manno-octulosonic-acid transferase